MKAGLSRLVDTVQTMKENLNEANAIIMKTNNNLEYVIKRPKFEQEELEELYETLKREKYEKIRAE